MRVKEVTALEHYERLVAENNDPARDSEQLQEYMSRWDGPKFYQCLGSCKGKRILEVGVGTGRLARKVLSLGCQEFTGIDISPSTVNRAKENLAEFSSAELLVADIQEYRRSSYYDIAYSILTFMHIENKEIALLNMVDSVRVGGSIILSISEQNDWLEYGDRKVRLFLTDVDEYANQLKKLGCHVEEQIEILDGFIYKRQQHRSESYGQKIATLFKATRQRQD